MNWYKQIKLADKKSFIISDLLQRGIDQHLAEQIANWSLSIHKKGASWIARLWANKKIEYPEDEGKLKEKLQLFDNKKQLLPAELRNINNYQSYAQLAQTLEQYVDVESKRQTEKDSTIKGQEVIKQQPPYTVVKITTKEAAAELLRGTNYCVKDPKFWEDYEKKLGKHPYYLVYKNDKIFALVHTPSFQAKDKYDEQFPAKTTVSILEIIFDKRDLVDMPMYAKANITVKAMNNDYDNISPHIKDIFIEECKDYSFYDQIEDDANGSFEVSEAVEAEGWALVQWMEHILITEQPKTFVNIVKRSLFDDKYDRDWIPTFAQKWAKNLLNSGNMPQEWIDRLHHYIINKQFAFIFADDWIDQYFISGNMPRGWLDAINKSILENGHLPQFAMSSKAAKNWAKNLLISGQAPQSWIEGINKMFIDNGIVFDFARDWFIGQLQSGNVPQQWMPQIMSHINEDKPYSSNEIKAAIKQYYETSMQQQEPNNELV